MAEPLRLAFEVMGTVVSVAAREVAPPAFEDAVARLQEWLRWVDRTFTTYDTASELMRLDRGELHLDQCAPEMREVLELCDQARQRTGGYFDARSSGRLDPSGLVKGWSVERGSALLATAGVPWHCVNAGGDVRAVAPDGAPPWRVGIADPERPGGLVHVVDVRSGAVATSGPAERGAHVRDPFTGRAPEHWASVTVIGPDLTWADAYATAAVAMGSAAEAWLDGVDGYDGWFVANRTRR